MTGQPLGPCSQNGTARDLKQAASSLASSLVSYPSWGAPELEAFSFLHLLFAVSPLSHLVMLEAGFWVQLRSFLLTPLPFQETSCRTCSAGSCCEEMRLGVVVLSLVKGCATS